ncbi:ABC transporter permease [Plantactinospora mayteni]|uniref:Peptide ABC transporter permease n=1 Tax=Plantactinospora mayteni TaxID=566021 RepID=A0ABQ4EGV6_9ACTN|nr:ABC transporter permease [Plantactinospora mayteni]GIG93958.1 peptide ABC transporter permease [Plantactinospora mayteni]
MLYFVRRFAFFVATLWAAVTLNFLIPRLQPGDPAEAIVSRLAGRNEAIDPAQVRAVRIMLGAPDGSLLEQYVQYLGAVARGDFGVSYSYFPYSVTHMIGQTLLWTVILVGVTQVISFVVGTLLGTWAAYRRNSRVDSIITLGSTFLGTLPFFWLALLLIYVFAITLRWFPERGGYGGGSTPGWSWLFVSDAIQHSVLPATALLITGPIGWIIGMRNNMVQSLGEDHARLALARGLPRRRIALTYGARLAILPNVTGFAIALGGILGGTVLVESVFNYPGMGRLLLEAVSNRDFPLMQAIFLFTTIGVLVANFLADVLYGVLDPRVRRAEST